MLSPCLPAVLCCGVQDFLAVLGSHFHDVATTWQNFLVTHVAPLAESEPSVVSEGQPTCASPFRPFFLAAKLKVIVRITGQVLLTVLVVKNGHWLDWGLLEDGQWCLLPFTATKHHTV